MIETSLFHPYCSLLSHQQAIIIINEIPDSDYKQQTIRAAIGTFYLFPPNAQTAIGINIYRVEFSSHMNSAQLHGLPLNFLFPWKNLSITTLVYQVYRSQPIIINECLILGCHQCNYFFMSQLLYDTNFINKGMLPPQKDYTKVILQSNMSSM